MTCQIWALESLDTAGWWPQFYTPRLNMGLKVWPIIEKWTGRWNYQLKHKIDAVELVDEKNRVLSVELFIGDNSFVLDKGDVWNLYSICETVFNKMEDNQ